MPKGNILLEACEELANKIKNNNATALEIAEIINRVGGEHTIPQIRDILKSEYSVDVGSNGTISKWCAVHTVFVQRLGIPIDDLSPFSPYKLYKIKDQVTIENAWDLINATLDKTIKELEEESGEKSEKASIVLPREVYERVDEARKLVSFDGEGNENALSMELFLSFVADLFISMRPSQRVALYGLVTGDTSAE